LSNRLDYVHLHVVVMIVEKDMEEK
jgi:hypothetical protein